MHKNLTWHVLPFCSDGLSKHEAVFCELLNETEKPPSFGPPLRTLMKLPLDRIKCYAYLLKKLTEYYPQVGTDVNISKEVKMTNFKN